MVQDPPVRRDPTTGVPVPSLRVVLDQDQPIIERGINNFLARRGNTDTVAAGLRESIAVLRRHIYLEQEFLFPPLRRAGRSGPVAAMFADHHTLWCTLEQMEQQLTDGSPPKLRLQTGRILAAEFDRHISREDPIVFRHAEEVLTPDEQATLRDAVDHAALPSEWTCPDPATS